MKATSTTVHGWTTRHSEYEEAAIRILKRAKGALTISELISAMLAEGLVTVRGSTPKKTLYASIARKERRRSETGAKPVFERVQEGKTVRYRLYVK